MALYKRPGSKYWQMKFTFNGELVQRSTMVANKRDAQTVESAFRTQLALGKIGIAPKPFAPTFETAADDFLTWAKVKHNGSDTFKRYAFSCQTLKKFFGKTKVDKIGAKDVEKFIAWRSGNISRKTGLPISREVVNKELIALKIIFKRLIEDRILQTNPASSIKALPENERQFHVITPDEEKAYLMACPQPLRDVAVLMLETGMRCGEVYRIRRSDVFLESNYLQITSGKTRSSVRRVYFSDKTRSVILARLNRLKGENLFPMQDTDFAKPTGSLGKPHAKVLGKLKMKFRLYDCRHTFASRAAAQGVNLVTLAAMLGHANLKMVMRYAHPSENEKHEAVKQMQKRA